MSFDPYQCLRLPFRPVEHFPECPAVYVVYATPNIVLYVGATKSLRSRLRDHGHLRRLDGLYSAWFPLPCYLHRDAERRLIRELRPVLNCHHVPSGSIHIHSLRTTEIQEFIDSERTTTNHKTGRRKEAGR